jgi:hypothetical protein
LRSRATPSRPAVVRRVPKCGGSLGPCSRERAVREVCARGRRGSRRWSAGRRLRPGGSSAKRCQRAPPPPRRALRCRDSVPGSHRRGRCVGAWLEPARPLARCHAHCGAVSARSAPRNPGGAAGGAASGAGGGAASRAGKLLSADRRGASQARGS